MSLVDDLKLRVSEDFPGCALCGFKPELTVSAFGTTTQIVQPFDLQLICNFEQNFVSVAVVTLNPGNEIQLAPPLVRNILSNLREGRSGTGAVLIEGKTFSSREFVFNKQIYVYTDKASFDTTLATAEFKNTGLRLLLREFGSAVKLEQRSALIIGVSAYVHTKKLTSPVNDAMAMDSTLSSLGFQTTLLTDVSQKELKKEIDGWSAELSGTHAALVYFAGHGLQVNGYNYLVPTDAACTSESQVEYDCVRADRTLTMIDSSSNCDVRLLILDACRDNPFIGSPRGPASSGLATMDAPEGTLIAYATSPGKTASDGDGNNGLYTSELLKHIATPGISCEEVFKRTRRGVKESSNGDQLPWETTSLVGDFFFKR